MCDQAWTAFFPAQLRRRRKPRQGRADRRTTPFFTRLVKTADPLLLENKGHSHDSSLSTAISRVACSGKQIFSPVRETHCRKAPLASLFQVKWASTWPFSLKVNAHSATVNATNRPQTPKSGAFARWASTRTTPVPYVLAVPDAPFAVSLILQPYSAPCLPPQETDRVRRKMDIFPRGTPRPYPPHVTGSNMRM